MQSGTRASPGRYQKLSIDEDLQRIKDKTLPESRGVYQYKKLYRPRVYGPNPVQRDIFYQPQYCKRDFYIERKELPEMTRVRINQFDREKRSLSPILKKTAEFTWKVTYE